MSKEEIGEGRESEGGMRREGGGSERGMREGGREGEGGRG